MIQTKKQLSLIFLLLFAVGFISAVTVYAGDKYEIELGTQYEYYSIVGNTSAVDLEVMSNGDNATIIWGKYSKNDSFEIIFFDREDKIITVYESSGGGGTKTIYKDRNITKYIDRKVDRIKEVPGETITVEKEVNVSSNLTKILIGVILFLIIFFMFFLWKLSFESEENEKEEKKEDEDEGEEEEEENIEEDEDLDSEEDIDERGFEEYDYE